MTPEKVLEVVKTYRSLFQSMEIRSAERPRDVLFCGTIQSLEHCHSMLDKIVGFVHEGRMEKAFRWLGFIQGVLWATQVYTVDELKNHNRP